MLDAASHAKEDGSGQRDGTRQSPAGRCWRAQQQLEVVAEVLRPLKGKQVSERCRQRLCVAAKASIAVFQNCCQVMGGLNVEPTAEVVTDDIHQNQRDMDGLSKDLEKARQHLKEAENRIAVLESTHEQTQALEECGELVRTITIPAGQPAGAWSYRRVFLQQVGKASRIDLKEPYLVAQYHQEGLETFLAGIKEDTFVQHVHIITNERSLVRKQALDEMVARMMPMQITIDYQKLLHEREMRTDRGNVVVSDRGIDLYTPMRRGTRRTRNTRVRYYDVSEASVMWNKAKAPETPMQQVRKVRSRSRTPDREKRVGPKRMQPQTQQQQQKQKGDQIQEPVDERSQSQRKRDFDKAGSLRDEPMDTGAKISDRNEDAMQDKHSKDEIQPKTKEKIKEAGASCDPTGHFAELRVIALFDAKWKLNPLRTKTLLARMTPTRRRFVIQTFKTDSGILEANNDLEKYIQQCEKTNAWSFPAPAATVSEAAKEPADGPNELKNGSVNVFKELNAITLFVTKWKLNPLRTKTLLQRMSQERRRFVIQTFKTTADFKKATDALERYIQQCEKTNTWSVTSHRPEQGEQKAESYYPLENFEPELKEVFGLYALPFSLLKKVLHTVVRVIGPNGRSETRCEILPSTDLYEVIMSWCDTRWSSDFEKPPSTTSDKMEFLKAWREHVDRLSNGEMLTFNGIEVQEGDTPLALGHGPKDGDMIVHAVPRRSLEVLQDKATNDGVGGGQGGFHA